MSTLLEIDSTRNHYCKQIMEIEEEFGWGHDLFKKDSERFYAVENYKLFVDRLDAIRIEYLKERDSESWTKR